MKYEVRLSIKAMVRYEMMTGKSFQDIDYTDTEDITNMMYCAVLCSNDVDFTKEEFLSLAENEKVLTDMTKRLMKNSLIIQQFTVKVDTKTSTDHKTDSVFVKDIVSTLIISAGMDAKYVMEQMSFLDLPLFMSAYEQRKKEEIESLRLWTFHTISPHIDRKKLKNPKDWISLPWELDAIKREAEIALQRDKEAFDKFMRGELFDLSKLN